MLPWRAADIVLRRRLFFECWRWVFAVIDFDSRSSRTPSATYLTRQHHDFWFQHHEGSAQCNAVNCKPHHFQSRVEFGAPEQFDEIHVGTGFLVHHHAHCHGACNRHCRNGVLLCLQSIKTRVARKSVSLCRGCAPVDRNPSGAGYFGADQQLEDRQRMNKAEESVVALRAENAEVVSQKGWLEKKVEELQERVKELAKAGSAKVPRIPRGAALKRSRLR